MGTCSGPGLMLAVLKERDLLKNIGARELVLATFAKDCCGRRRKAVALLEELCLKENVGVEYAVSKLSGEYSCCVVSCTCPCPWAGRQRRGMPPLVSFVPGEVSYALRLVNKSPSIA